MKVVDAIKITYREFFTIAVLHPAFETIFTYKDPVTGSSKTVTGSTLAQVLSIEPDAASKKLVADYFMQVRYSNNQVYCFVRVVDESLFIPMPADLRIRFLIKPKNDFLHRTHVIAAGPRRVYWFGNTNHTISNGIKHISKGAGGVSDADLQDASTVLPSENCLGVIDIMNSVTDADYKLLDADVPQGPVFTIRFNAK